MRRHLIVLVLALLGTGLAACSTTPPTGTPSPSSSSPSLPSASVSTPGAPTDPSAQGSATEMVDIVLRGDGIGAYGFGAAEKDVTALLETELGKPDSSSQGLRCELDAGSPWIRTLNWGPLWVEYAARDRSRKSSRTLAAWGLASNAKANKAISIQDNLSPNLTFSDLKAKYPTGKTVELFDDGKRFILPNKIFYVGSGNTPDHMQAGHFSTCE